jgi:hypothetical protein
MSSIQTLSFFIPLFSFLFKGMPHSLGVTLHVIIDGPFTSEMPHILSHIKSSLVNKCLLGKHLAPGVLH